MNLKEQRAAALKAARDIVDGAKTDNRDLTPDEQATVEQHMAEVKGLDVQLKGKALVDSVMALGTSDPTPEAEQQTPAKSLGEHFAKSVGPEQFARLKSQSGYSVGTPEFKAATDTFNTDSGYSQWLTQVDTSFERGYRPGPVVADLMGSGTLGPNSNAITYFIEGAWEGQFTTVAEGAQKPQVHLGDPTTRTDPLRKIAAWWDTSDEMVEDLPFMVSEINNRGLYELSMVEENQLLNGDGTGTNVLGLLNRSGIQTEAAAAGGADNADSLFRALTKVQTATGLMADGILINPADYQKLRLNKDGNGQYFGGGYFSGQYGNGGVPIQPPLWGLRTVVTSAVGAGTAVVAAFQQATTVYRKGGVRVESTNSDLGKFTSNIITTRIEERIALAVRKPAAVVKVTLT